MTRLYYDWYDYSDYFTITTTNTQTMSMTINKPEYTYDYSRIIEQPQDYDSKWPRQVLETTIQEATSTGLLHSKTSVSQY